MAEAVPPLLVLLDLMRRARDAAGAEELAFLAVNDSHALAAYRQAALWFAADGVRALSGVVQPEANAPYAQWQGRVCAHFSSLDAGPAARRVGAADLPPEEAGEWAEWLPAHGLWLPLAADPGRPESSPGGLLLAAERPWSDQAIGLLQEWLAAWRHTWLARLRPAPWSWGRLRQRLAAPRGLSWWRQPRTRLAVLCAAAELFPVRLTVLAPGELVPARPAVIRAPLDGIVESFQVVPNQEVAAGQALFAFDEAQLATRRDVAAQALATAEAEYRQFAQQALSDAKSKGQLAILLGKIEEKRAEAAYLREQAERARVTAPQAGIALFDDPSEWIGRPVQAGERVMRIAAPGDAEVEAWLPLGDAIPLPEGAEVSLYLAATPLGSLSARIRYVAHDAVMQPNGVYAYRVRARLDAPTDQRVGLKGTAKLHGERVPLVYWVLRRPLAAVRQFLGI